MLRVDIKLRLDFNQLPLKMQTRSFHVLLINKTRLNFKQLSSTDISVIKSTAFWCCPVGKCDKSISSRILSTCFLFEFFFYLLMLSSLMWCLAAILWWFFTVNWPFSFSAISTCSTGVIDWTWFTNPIDVFGGKIISWLLLLRTGTVI